MRIKLEWGIYFTFISLKRQGLNVINGINYIVKSIQRFFLWKATILYAWSWHMWIMLDWNEKNISGKHGQRWKKPNKWVESKGISCTSCIKITQELLELSNPQGLHLILQYAEPYAVYMFNLWVGHIWYIIYMFNR